MVQSAARNLLIESWIVVVISSKAFDPALSMSEKNLPVFRSWRGIIFVIEDPSLIISEALNWL